MAQYTPPVARTVYRLKVTLREVSPPVWRRIEIPASTYLDDLHLMIQAAMGWENFHLHKFVINGCDYGEPDPDYDDPPMEAGSQYTLRQLLRRAGSRFVYEYDFGDGWIHDVLLEKIVAPAPGVIYPVCVAGERACPPEDCGGPWGYGELLKIVTNPMHDDYDGFVEWLGGEFDPAVFDIDEANGLLEDYRAMDAENW
ncbi:MAG: plasmid pRiA4b ORF-3 family protein [Phycisphaerae bacterium]|nr:plasmid pRiA4b ORF-3 family protein [Phycisphaerae bacterium]